MYLNKKTNKCKTIIKEKIQLVYLQPDFFNNF